LRRLVQFARSIQGRLTSLVVIIVTAAVISTGAVDFFARASRMRESIRETTAHDAQIVAAIAADRLGRGRIVEFQSQLAALVRDQDFTRFNVVDPAHGVTYVGTEGGKALPFAPREPLVEEAALSRRKVARDRDGAFHVLVPAIEDGKVLAVVDVIVPTSLSGEKVAEMLAVTAASGLVLIAVFVPFGLLVAQGIALPLRRITACARRIHEGDFDLEPLPAAMGEIGDLSAALNEMVVNLRNDTAEIRRLAFTDVVTGLANRERFRSTLAYALRVGAGDDIRRAVIFIDLDHFKQINDAFGHNHGDATLALTGERLREVVTSFGYELMRAEEFKSSTRPDERLALVSRHASDQFAVFLRNHRGEGELAQLGRSICDAAKQAIEVDGSSVELGASVGIVDFRVGVSDPSEIMRFADLAMFEAKAGGRNRFAFFTRELDLQLRERLLTEMELRKAAGLGELRVFYMPKVPMAGGEVCGAEALVRWQHPRHGLIAPAAFIEIAEESGLVVEIDRTVLDEACRQASEWARQGTPIAVAVNVSAVEFQRADFVDWVLTVLERHGLDPVLLEIELTESMAMANPRRVAAIITQLRAVGIRFAIDDFGTGYSNLGHLTTLSFDVLKIDQSFIRALDEGQRADAEVIVETILSLANNLGVETVAEGVETAEQAAYLERQGCLTGQGYYYGKPMGPGEFERLFLDRRRTAAVA
jgi:predicted signal transduction protein with EAL and GGDEF domain